MIWLDVADGDLEVGVLEVGDLLELVALDDGDHVLWVWRTTSGAVLSWPESGAC